MVMTYSHELRGVEVIMSHHSLKTKNGLRHKLLNYRFTLILNVSKIILTPTSIKV